MSPDCLPICIPIPNYIEDEAEKDAYIVKSLMKLAEGYLNKNPAAVEILNDLDIPNLIQSGPYESIECIEHPEGTFSIDLKNIRLAIENLLADHSFAYEVILEDDRLLIQELPDTADISDNEMHPFYREMLPKSFGGRV